MKGLTAEEVDVLRRTDGSILFVIDESTLIPARAVQTRGLLMRGGPDGITLYVTELGRLALRIYAALYS